MKFKSNLFLIFTIIIFCGCSKNNDENNAILPKEKRTFYMGTTPWPADLTIAEVNKT